ncbi:MAG: restriction endonuclease subunit S [Eubacterium sp.]|nr:restriction endonuclease subunit S [Eubacterium sp.]
MIDTVALKRRDLELAMTGKLSKYQLGDDKIGDVRDRIIKEKEDLLIKRNGRKDNNIKNRDECENDELPENWTWIRFGETGLFKKGPFGSALTKSMFVPKSEDTVKVYEQQHAINKKHTLGTYYITREYFEDSMSGFEVQPGDIIVSCAGTIGETYIMPEDMEQGIINQALMRVSLIPSIYDKFFLYYFDYGLKKAAKEESNGSAIKNIPPFDVMKNWLFPITSIQEQRRIVGNIEKMYQWIDTIDILQMQYSSDLEVLKSKIIDAGIQGKLTEQLPEDGTAEELLEQIAKEKKQLIKEKKIKATKALPEITEDEIPFEIPVNWKWVRLADICSKITSGNTPAGGSKGGAYVTEGNCFFREQNIYNDGIHYEGMVYITDELLATRENSTVLPQDILLNITGGSIGRCALIPDDFSKGSINQHILIIRVIEPEIRQYIHKCLCSPYYQKLIMGNVVGDKDGAGRCKNTLIPLPPIGEQKRIVEKITQILEQI